MNNIEDFIELHNLKIKDLGYLRESLTHPSYSNENNLNYSNQKLEFLGDSVISLIVTEYLYLKTSGKNEGELSKIKSILVSKDVLGEAGQRIGLPDYMYYGAGEEKSGGRYKLSNLEDGFEAVVGAIYLSTNFNVTKEFVMDNIKDKLDELLRDGVVEYKSRLQEALQGKYKKSVDYKVLEESGPEHNKGFTSGVYWNGELVSVGHGKSKKEAERNGAKIAYSFLKTQNII